MADFKYQRDTNRMYCLGLDLNRPVDAVKELHFPLLKNVRPYQTGRLEPRMGLTLIGIAAGSPIHSIRRLNAPRTSTWTRVVGGGTLLSTGQANCVHCDTGYSGNPLAMIPYRPPQSPDPWMYCMDSSRQRKVDVSGNVHQVGLPPPTTVPVVTRGVPLFKAAFAVPYVTTNWHWGNQFSDGSWDWSTSNVGTGGTVGNRVNTTVTAIVYDSGTTGWCCIQPASAAGLSSGMILVLDRTGTSSITIASEVFAKNPPATTITAITFISGTSGACSIVLASAANMVKNALLYNSTRTAYARITSVTKGPDDQISVECSTPAAGWAAGDTCYTVPTIRCYTAVTIQAADAIEADYFGHQTSGGPDGLTSTMISPSLGPVDWSTLGTGVATTPDDYIHLSFAMNTPAQVQSCRLILCCANVAYTAALNTDYYYKDFTAQDLAASLEKGMKLYTPPTESQWGQESGIFTVQESLQRALQRGEIDQAQYNMALYGVLNPTAGQFSWGELDIKVSELIPVGTPNLATVYFIAWQCTVLAPSSLVASPASATYLGNVNVRGGYGADVGLGDDYIYRYRARCASTGVISNWGPATRESFHLIREQTSLVAPAQYTLAAEADYLDYQRKGGALPDWHYVGSVANSAAPASLTDKYPDDVIASNANDDQEHYQLWPVLGAPASGTTTKVCGTIVTATDFSTSWAPLTRIEINGVFYTIYRVNSATQLELYESAGSQTTVAWRVAEPILLAQTIPCFWGPLHETLFGCGDTVNPQRLYWTNVGSGDDTTLAKWKDVTNPSEPLQNGVVYNGRLYLWSTERMFQILPGGQDEAGNVVDWNIVEIPNAGGLISRWAFTGFQSPPGSQLAFLSKDGIYATDGGIPSSMTDENLMPLFPNEGNPGFTVNQIPAPDIVAANQAYHRLSYYDDFTYFNYVPKE